MTIVPEWFRRPRPLFADNSKGPWGGTGGGSDNNSGGGGAGSGGPRNPWSPPPLGPRGRVNKPTALDEWLKRARGGGGGGGPPFGSGGPGMPNLRSRTLWLSGAGVLLALWVLVTSFHAIGPKQHGVVTYLGKYAGILDPGIRMTAPAPFAAVQKIDVETTRVFDFPENGGQNLVLTGDQNIVDLTYSVRWRISVPQDFAFQIADPDSTVRATAESAMRSVMANSTLDQAIGAGRGVIEQQVAVEMQRILDGYKAGIRIEGVAIKGASPPPQVVDAFKDVSAAQQDYQASINNARGYAQQIVAQAQGEAARFDRYYEQYKLAPEVTRRRLYYETMEDVLSRTNKTIMAAPGVVPYLPIPPGMRRAPEANVQVAPPAPAAAPAAAPQGGQ